MRVIGLVLLITFLSPLAHSLEIGDPAPCVTIDHVQKGVESFHCVKDQDIDDRPVIVEFFSTTCSACVANLPNIKRVGKELEGKATVRMVAIDKKIDLVKQFIAKYEIELEVGLDFQQRAAKAFDVAYTPTLYLMDNRNKLIYQHVGTLKEADIQEIYALVENYQSPQPE